MNRNLKEKKFTLPLIYALNNASFFDKRRIISTIRNNNNDTGKIEKVIDFVMNSGGIEYATKKMKKKKQKKRPQMDRALKIFHDAFLLLLLVGDVCDVQFDVEWTCTFVP